MLDGYPNNALDKVIRWRRVINTYHGADVVLEKARSGSIVVRREKVE
jgi:hypothetical protein